MLIALAFRAANLWYMAPLPIAEYQATWPACDMELNHRWASAILAGDLLSRDTPHQETVEMQHIAPIESWYQWWGGRQVLHWAPLYPYTLAGMRAVAHTRSR